MLILVKNKKEHHARPYHNFLIIHSTCTRH